MLLQISTLGDYNTSFPCGPTVRYYTLQMKSFEKFNNSLEYRSLRVSSLQRREVHHEPFPGLAELIFAFTRYLTVTRRENNTATYKQALATHKEHKEHQSARITNLNGNETWPGCELMLQPGYTQ